VSPTHRDGWDHSQPSAGREHERARHNLAGSADSGAQQGALERRGGEPRSVPLGDPGHLPARPASGQTAPRATVRSVAKRWPCRARWQTGPQPAAWWRRRSVALGGWRPSTTLVCAAGMVGDSHPRGRARSAGGRVARPWPASPPSRGRIGSRRGGIIAGMTTSAHYRPRRARPHLTEDARRPRGVAGGCDRPVAPPGTGRRHGARHLRRGRGVIAGAVPLLRQSRRASSGGRGRGVRRSPALLPARGVWRRPAACSSAPPLAWQRLPLVSTPRGTRWGRG